MIGRPRDDETTLSLMRKALFTIVTGGVTYLLTDLFQQPPLGSLTLSAFIGGATLVIQFMSDFDSRLSRVESEQHHHADRMEKLVGEGFSKINEATELFGLVEASVLRNDAVTQLVRHSTQIDPKAPALIFDFAHSQIARMADFMKELSEGGDVTYPDGEDRDWLLALARGAQKSIDATSLSKSDPKTHRGIIDEGLWDNDLGQRYLEAQKDAIERGVTIRRVFIIDRSELAQDPAVRQVCQLQDSIGIHVRILDPRAASVIRRSSMLDFIVFDDVLSYEMVPASQIGDGQGTVIANTRLVLRQQRVKERIQGFEDLWESAYEFGEESDRTSARPGRT